MGGMAAVGSYIRRLRERQHLTAAEVAARAEVEPNYVWRLETAQVGNPGLANIASVIRALNGSADDVFALFVGDRGLEEAQQLADQRLLVGTAATAPPDDLAALLLEIRQTLERERTPNGARELRSALRALIHGWQSRDY